MPGGCTDPRALQIDHVNNDGHAEPLKAYRYGFLKSVLADTAGRFQLLCANCNVIKAHDALKETKWGQQEKLNGTEC